jgi:hypothetical protein
MAAFTSILIGIGIAASVAGAVMTATAQSKAAKAQMKAIEEQRKAEEVRRKQMQTDAARKRRGVIREMQIARAQAANNATNQGAAGGSGLYGGYGQISGQAGSQIVGINNVEGFGNRIFDHNANASQFYQQAAGHQADAAFGGTMQSIGGGLSSMGNSIARNYGAIQRVGGWA